MKTKLFPFLLLIFLTSSCLEKNGSLKVNPSTRTWLKQFGSVTNPGSKSSGYDECWASASDRSGNVYCMGPTNSDFNETNPGVGTTSDIFFMKLNSSGVVQWITHLGQDTKLPGGDHSGTEDPYAIAVDEAGNVYASGLTQSDMADTHAGTGDAFVVKLNSSGEIAWITQLGQTVKPLGGDTSQYDHCYAVTVDRDGYVYCGGTTQGDLSETSGGGQDIFVMKLNPDGELVWVTQLGQTTKVFGGSNAGHEGCFAISVDSSGNVYCGGYTSGSMGEANGGGTDVVIVKLNSSGVLKWITQFGAVTKAAPGGSNAGSEACDDLVLDSSRNIYCAGATSGAMVEAHGGGDQDAIVIKLNSSGDVEWATQFGAVTKAPGGSNAGNEFFYALTLDEKRNLYLAGNTNGSMGEANGGAYDIFVTKLNSQGNLVWLTQFGQVTNYPGASSSATEYAWGISIDGEGYIYVAGGTNGNVGEQNGGEYDALIFKLTPSGTF
jgi:hypothetical protein